MGYLIEAKKWRERAWYYDSLPHKQVDVVPDFNPSAVVPSELDCASKYSGQPMFITGEHGRLAWEACNAR